MLNLKTRSLLLPALALFSLALASCGGGSGTEEVPDPRVRALNLSPGTTIDVTINGDTEITDVAYLAEGFEGVSRNPGSYDFGIRQANSTVDLVAEAYDLQSGANYVYASVGLAEFGDESAKRIRGALIGYDRDSPGESKARVIALNAFVTEAGTEPGPVVFEAPGESPVFSFPALAFGGSSTQVLDAGPQTFEVRSEGAEATLASATVSLLPGRTYIAAYSGQFGGTGSSAPAVRLLLVP